MILEQLVASLFQNEINKEYTTALKSFLEVYPGDKVKAEEAYNHLIQLAQNKEQLGIQYEDSAELIKALRNYIGTDKLINLATLLGTEEYSTPEKILEGLPTHAQEAYIKSIKNLHLICAGLQTLPGITAATVGSGGAVIGTSLVISKLFPELAKSLNINENQTATLSLNVEQEKREVVSSFQLTACPYLKAKQRAYNAPTRSKSAFFAEKTADKTTTSTMPNETTNQEVKTISNTEQSSWSPFFKKAAVATTIGIGTLLLYSSNG